MHKLPLGAFFQQEDNWRSQLCDYSVHWLHSRPQDSWSRSSTKKESFPSIKVSSGDDELFPSPCLLGDLQGMQLQDRAELSGHSLAQTSARSNVRTVGSQTCCALGLSVNPAEA